jgi:hypothetical protein
MDDELRFPVWVAMTAETPVGRLRAWGLQSVERVEDYRPTLQRMRARIGHDLRQAEPTERAHWMTAVTDDPVLIDALQQMADAAQAMDGSITLEGFPGVMEDNGI